MVTFIVPGKVTSSNMVKTPMAFGRAVKTSSAREDHSRIAARALAVKMATKGYVKPERAEVRIMALNSRLDVDNLPKTILDGIKGILIMDDNPKHLGRLVVEHFKDKKGERYVVSVLALDAGAYQGP